MKQVGLYLCESRRGSSGGWGALLVYSGVCREFSGSHLTDTGMAMLLTGVTSALSALKEPCAVTIYCRNQIVVAVGSGTYKVGKYPDKWKFYFESAHRHVVTWRLVSDKDGLAYDKKAHILAHNAALTSPVR